MKTERLTTALADRYHIERELGAGGMATVYLAEDVRHHRKVAIKVLHAELAAVIGAERFLAEIRTTANLQHPHILGLIDSGDVDGIPYYVMPFVPGDSLRDRLTRERQLPVDDAVRLSREIAAALDYAHRAGIIHRDIKPENILLHDGAALVADFGIALAVQSAGGQRMTQTGLSLGTPQYMSPEQAMGEKTLDARADIYALGCLAYEMLVGEPPFTGPTTQAIIARVITEEPRGLIAQRKTIPPGVEDAVLTALSKLPADRWGSAREFADALQESRTSRGMTGRMTAATRPRARVHPAIPWALAAVGFIGAALLGLQLLSAPLPSPVRFALSLSPGELVDTRAGVAISRDGRTVVYASQIGNTTQLFARDIDQLAARPVPGTAGAASPVISPNGQWLAFSSADGTLRRVPLSGGPGALIAKVAAPAGVTWSPNGTIVFGMPMFSRTTRGLSRVPAERDTAVQPFTADPRGGMHHDPIALADGEHVLFTSFGGGTVIGVAALSTGKDVALDVTGGPPLGVADGILVYLAQGAVMAVPYDTRRNRVTGTPVRVSEELMNVRAGALADNGTLTVVRQPTNLDLLRVDMRGIAQPFVTGQPTRFQPPRSSPDGRRVLAAMGSTRGAPLSVYDATLRTPSALGVDGVAYEWSPDGARVLVLERFAGSRMSWMNADGSDSARTLFQVPGAQIHDGVMSPDGRTMVVTTGVGAGTLDIKTVSLNGDTTATPFVATPANELMPRFSRDGRWLAYASDASGRYEVYVRAFPGPGLPVQVSDSGGAEPVWSRDGRRLYYRSGRRMVAASVTPPATGTTLTVSGRTTLFEGDFESLATFTSYDVSPDDSHFLMLRPAGNARPEVIVWLNWLDELKARMREK